LKKDFRGLSGEISRDARGGVAMELSVRDRARWRFGVDLAWRRRGKEGRRRRVPPRGGEFDRDSICGGRRGRKDS
jgi:hypothetical protein